ncbi:centrosomal protein of 57 kDa-like isoform X1 [Thalassophryne amazonica]|uniref:centrosomal protein of 57 kDa-like isoform X1 n=1 Tax=Thalassophryne amazonica TaxID=390379 RepID=UPI0014709037|nr:centrosomal protein of 57 kDa-like isoform X1 [Thalassophryne amazonica]
MDRKVFLNEFHTGCPSLETHQDQMSDSTSTNSFIGSYCQPPDRIRPVPRKLEVPGHTTRNTNLHTSSTRVFQNKPSIVSQGVVDALKTLQEKIRKLELERKQAEESYQKFSQDIQKHSQYMASSNVYNQPAVGLSDADNASRRELDVKLQSTEVCCHLLEKQLDCMSKMVQNAKKGRHVVFEEEASLQSQNRPKRSSTQTRQEKLEKFESDYLKVCTTQSLAELQMEFDLNIQPPSSAAEKMNPKRQTKRTIKKKLRPKQSAPPSELRYKKVPFVAGTSTSPSHSVHANLQSVLHMMKHHQPQLCEQVCQLQRAGSGAKKSLKKSFSPDSRSEPPTEPLSLLSDLLLALQDELGRMSFEQQELMQQLDAAEQQEHRLDLQRELESLAARMEEKGAQITQVRKHQQAVQKLSMATRRCPAECTDEAAVIRRPSLPAVTVKPQRKKVRATQKNLKLCNYLKEDDCCWET